MIKINKGYTMSDIPGSLRVPDATHFEDGRILPQSFTTQRKREELMAAARYIDDGKYDGRYKLDDIKKALNDIYSGKCAFCEQKVEQFHVEHYRPKQIYYWLAFSWDNLLVACPKCNEYKGTNFPVATDSNTTIVHRTDINIQSNLHDISEQPYLVNPEVSDPASLIYFNRDGSINSDDPRFYYIIR